MSLREFRADLHIHTCLSPCADAAMRPTAIIEEARRRKLDMVGIADHNSAENVPAMQAAGRAMGVPVLGGMEICSSEEVHVLAFFDDDDALFAMQEIVYDNLIGRNDEAYFGEQRLIDEHDAVIGATDRLLIGATLLGVNDIVGSIRGLGGLAIASHVDREAYGLISQLGFVPQGLPLNALEVSWRCSPADAEAYRGYGLELIRSSDAHYLSDVGRVWTTFRIEAPRIGELAMAFEGREDRRVSI